MEKAKKACHFRGEKSAESWRTDADDM